jgi:polar amino acid transport system permease protein
VSSFHWDWGFAWAILPELLQGLVVTVLATLLGSMVALALGMVWTLVRVRRIPS